MAENPRIWAPELRRRLTATIARVAELEIAYTDDCLPRFILGLNAGLFRDSVRHIADWRLERIGPWMSETIDLKKEKNFFETTVTEYQSAAALSWD